MRLDVPYAKAALPSLMMYEGMTREEAESFILANDFDGIESKAWASSSVRPAAEFIGREFGLTQEEMSEFVNEMLGKTDNTKVAELVKDALSPLTQTELAATSVRLGVDTMEYVHDNWVEGNTKHFFGKKADQEKQFQYLPLELIGWKEAKLDLQYIAPVMEAVGLKVDEAAIKRECNNRTVELIQQIGEDKLQEFIQSGCNGYHAHWTHEIGVAMSNPEFVDNVIVPEIESKGLGCDVELMQRMDKMDLEVFRDNDDRGPVIGE